ncbi:uncharacterized protein [Porites lutea]
MRNKLMFSNMAALRVKMMSSGNVRQIALRIPPVICRFMSNGSAAGGGDPQKPTSSISSQDTAPKPESLEKSTYKVQEYYSYNDYSFYDLENVIDSSGRRQIQPDPRQRYNHTDPWSKKESSTA